MMGLIRNRFPIQEITWNLGEFSGNGLEMVLRRATCDIRKFVHLFVSCWTIKLRIIKFSRKISNYFSFDLRKRQIKTVKRRFISGII